MSQLVMYDATRVIAELLRGAPDGRDYRISRMYVEFENNSGLVVSPPALSDRALANSYYSGLSVSGTRDYVSAPVTTTRLESTDAVKYSGNLVTFGAHVVAGTGVHGKPFSSAQESRIFGGALVATPDPDDPSQDLILHRFYYDQGVQQLILPASAGVIVECPLTLS